MSQDELTQFKPLYLKTAREYTQTLQATIEKLNQTPTDPKALEQLLIASHSLKSQSLFMQYTHLGHYAFAIEQLTRQAKTQNTPLSSQILQLIQNGIAIINQSLDAIEKSNQEIDMTEETEKLKNAAKSSFSF